MIGCLNFSTNHSNQWQQSLLFRWNFHYERGSRVQCDQKAYFFTGIFIMKRALEFSVTRKPRQMSIEVAQK